VSVAGRNVVPHGGEDKSMTRTLVAAAAAALTLAAVVLVSNTTAHAVPRCETQGESDCSGVPPYNGPLQNTWSHGWTDDPQMCSGGNTMQPCGFYVPQP
jgi:hypothetical protein